jgi:hypothetical protein
MAEFAVLHDRLREKETIRGWCSGMEMQKGEHSGYCESASRRCSEAFIALTPYRVLLENFSDA